MQKIYLSNIPRQEARQKFLTGVQIPRRREIIKTSESLGRITAEALFARLSMPGDHAAAMDGFAVLAERTFGATDQNPLQLEIGRAHV